MTAAGSPEPEFSHIVRLSDLPREGATYALEAKEDERAALTRRFGLEALDALAAEITLEWVSGGAFLQLHGHIRASVVQACVVTLDPVRTELEQPVEILFDPRDEEGSEVDLDPEENIEPLEGDALDIAEIVAEEMALMLDPYPRAPGVSAERLGPWIDGGKDELGGSGGARPGSPFEILAGLRRKQ